MSESSENMDDTPNTSEREAIMHTYTDQQERDRIEGSYDTTLKKKLTTILIMGVICLIAFICSLSIGSVDIPFTDTLAVLGHHLFPGWIDLPSETWYDSIIINERFPRSLLCLLTGISLAAAGTVMQGLLRNPLVSPFTLGVSTAASFGAAIAIVFGSGLFGTLFYSTFSILGMTFSVKNLIIVLLSFVLGMMSILIVLKVSKKDASRSTLVLSGVVISYLFSAGISLSQYLSDDESLREIANWLMGGMWNATWGAIAILTPIIILCFIYLERLALEINSLSAGDDIAKNVGIDVTKLRRQGLIVSTLTTSACVAFTGVVGFIGLMAPHMCRLIMGNDTRFVLPAAALLGASILMVSDIVSRVIFRPEQIPVGIIMYIIGGVFFIWMVTRKKWGDKL